MMPRLAKLISERRAKSKSYSTSPLGQAVKRKIAVPGKYYSLSGAGSGSSDATGEEASRLKRPYDPFGGAEDVTSGSGRGRWRPDDIELAMPEFDERHFSDLLEQRLNMGFSVPRLSYS